MMTLILFKSNKCLKLRVIFCIFNILINFIIYKIIHSFPNKSKSLPTKFCKCFWYNIKEIKVLSFICDAYSDL